MKLMLLNFNLTTCKVCHTDDEYWIVMIHSSALHEYTTTRTGKLFQMYKIAICKINFKK